MIAPHNGTRTSIAAARSVQHRVNSDASTIVRHVRECGTGGATCEEVALALKLRMSTASARIRGLVLEGLLVKAGRVRPTTSGHDAEVLIAHDLPGSA